MIYKHQIEIQELDDGSGDALIEFPPVLLKKLGWKEGDDLKFEQRGNGSIQIRKTSLCPESPRLKGSFFNPLDHEQTK